MYVVRAGRSEGEAMREDELAGHIPETEDEQPQERSFGCLFCITIIGIPFGMQCFKLAKLALMPFGASVR